MARFKDKKMALELRKQGMSYSQIKKSLNISKGTLSCWLRNFPLSRERISELRDNNEVRIERFRETMKKKRDARLKQYYDIQKKKILPLNKRDLFIAGLFLYWGEGSKSTGSQLGVSNTDPSMIKFFVRWFTECLRLPKSKLNVQLQLYKDMDINKEIKFWSDKLSIPQTQFTKPYIKESFLKNIDHKGGFGHGTCNIRSGNARIYGKILMGIKVICEKYNDMRL